MRRKYLYEGNEAFGMTNDNRQKNAGFDESNGLLNPFLDVQLKRLDEDSVALGIQIEWICINPFLDGGGLFVFFWNKSLRELLDSYLWAKMYFWF